MQTRHFDPARSSRRGAASLGAALTCAALVLLAGGTHAQPAAPPEEAAGQNTGDAEAARERSRQEREALLNQLRSPRRAPAAAPGAQEPVQGGGGAGDEAVGPDEFSFANFSEAVELQALVDLISKRLKLNIIIADGAVNGQVVFRAPMKVKESELLPLLQMLLEPNGYALTRDERVGALVIHPTSKLPIGLGPGELATTQVFPTPLVRPSSLQPAIQSLLSAEQQQMRIAYVDELGVIVSTASPRQNMAVGEVIDLVIRGMKGQRLHRFDLVHVAALEARQRILELVGQASGSTGARPAGAPGTAAAQPTPSPVAGGAGAMTNLPDRLVADRMGNSLFFRGSDGEYEQVRQYIELVDAPSRLVIRRYAAGPLSPVIASYGERLGLGPVLQGASAVTGGQSGAAPAAGPQGGSSVGSGFATDPGDPESFTYYGTLQQHKKVEELVAEYAEQARGEVLQIKFVKLKHARAADAASILTQLLEASGSGVAENPLLPRSLTNTRGLNSFGTQSGTTSRNRTSRGGLRGANPATGQIGGEGATAAATGDEANAADLTQVEGLSITADEPNNQLIVRAPARLQGSIKEIIDQIDQRRPQVYIEVQVVTVNRSRDFEFGVDWAIASDDIPFFTNFGIRGGANPFTPTLPASALAAAGVSAAVVRSSYIPFIINTLETKGDGRVMSSPRVLVNDNESATISSTTDEPFATTTQTAGAPSQTGLGGTLSAGTSLEIRPQVSEAGFMVLEFTVELSSFGERPNPDLPPTRRSDNLESIVTIPADSTVVIGGLTFKDFSSTKSQFPWLGDIPLIGYLFGSYSDSGSTRTLYVFITPRILRDPTFADLRLLTQGTLGEAEIDDSLPRLMPSEMPVIFSPNQAVGQAQGGAPKAEDQAPVSYAMPARND